jgi:acyl-coenzyme A synthetase/AMP-(fatty) acid ligase
LDHWGRPVAPGLVGELWIAGRGLARGYCSNAIATAVGFWPDPFARQPGQRMYRTGDLARLRPDGELEYLGRVDRQLKLRGFRIEPSEVEAALLSHPQVAAAAVSTRISAAGSTQLAGYVIGRGRSPPDPAELRSYLARSLPPQLIPAAIAVLTEFPLNRNGKVDYSQLAACATQQSRQHLRTLVERLEHASDEEVASMISAATSEG